MPEQEQQPQHWEDTMDKIMKAWLVGGLALVGGVAAFDHEGPLITEASDAVLGAGLMGLAGLCVVAIADNLRKD